APAHETWWGQHMATEIKMRSLGKMKSVDVLEVKVNVGDVVTKGQPLLEIESEKGTADFPSPVAGKIVQVLVKPDDKVVSGQNLCLAESREGPPAKAAPAPAPPPTPPRTKPEPRAAAQVKNDETPRPAPAPAPPPSRTTGNGLLVRAGPATRKLARKLG